MMQPSDTERRSVELCRDGDGASKEEARIGG
jgi:hypothetical protein